MTSLSTWLRGELDRRSLTLAQAAVFARVGQATLSDILNKGHIPKVQTLFRLADYFGVPRSEAVRLAANLPPEGGPGTGEEMERALVEEFRQVPDEWKSVVLDQVAFVRRLAQNPPMRIIGGEDEPPAQETAGSPASGACGEGTVVQSQAA